MYYRHKNKYDPILVNPKCCREHRLCEMNFSDTETDYYSTEKLT